MDQRLMDDLQELLDRDAIRDCVSRYARGIDRYDEELVRSAFHGDAFDAHGVSTVSVDDFVTTLMPELSEREATQHCVFNQQVEFEGDTAHVETYLVVVKKLHGVDDVELKGGRYLDRFEKREGEWKIAVRMLVMDWQLVADGSGMGQALAGYHRGVQGRDDPSYRRPLLAPPPPSPMT